MQKYTRQVVLMQKYMRRHLIRTKMKRKRRAGFSKVTKFKMCQRVMRGYLGRQRFVQFKMRSHAMDEIKDYGAGLYRNAMVYERDRMIVRCFFTLERDRLRLDRRRLREREIEPYDDGTSTSVAGTFRSTDTESCRLAGSLQAVFQHFCDMPQKGSELGSMKFAKFCKVGCHNLLFDFEAARQAGMKEERALRSGRFGFVRGTAVDLAFSKALGDMADLEVELAQQKASSQRPSSRERQKKNSLDFDGFCRALVYVARARYLDGHRPESRPGSRGRPGSRSGSRPGSRGGGSRPSSRSGSRPTTPNRGRPKSRERRRSSSKSPSRPGSAAGKGKAKDSSGRRPSSPFMESLSRPSSRQSQRSDTSSVDHGSHHDDPTLYRAHTDDEALILRLCDDHIFGGPLPKIGGSKKKRKRKKKKKQVAEIESQAFEGTVEVGGLEVHEVDEEEEGSGGEGEAGSRPQTPASPTLPTSPGSPGSPKSPGSPSSELPKKVSLLVCFCLFVCSVSLLFFDLFQSFAYPFTLHHSSLTTHPQP